MNDIFETNILNLIVVIAIVVKVIGETADSFLTKRKERIIERFTEADTEENIANTKLTNAQLAVKTAKEYCCTIREQGQQTLEVEKTKAHKLLERELQRIEQEHTQRVQREQAQNKKAIEQLILRIALRKAEQTLIKRFKEISPEEERKRYDAKLRTIRIPKSESVGSKSRRKVF
jgi:F-type H+-transporting ATPase subunit b